MRRRRPPAARGRLQAEVAVRMCFTVRSEVVHRLGDAFGDLRRSAAGAAPWSRRPVANSRWMDGVVQVASDALPVLEQRQLPTEGAAWRSRWPRGGAARATTSSSSMSVNTSAVVLSGQVEVADTWLRTGSARRERFHRGWFGVGTRSCRGARAGPAADRLRFENEQTEDAVALGSGPMARRPHRPTDVMNWLSRCPIRRAPRAPRVGVDQGHCGLDDVLETGPGRGWIPPS